MSLGLAVREPGQLITKGPYVQACGPTSMAVMWESPTDLPCRVCYGLEGKLTQRLPAGPPREWKGISTIYRTNLVSVKTNSHRVTQTNVVSVPTTNIFYVYTATLNDLEPGAPYTYAVAVSGARTRPRQCKTLRPDASKVRATGKGRITEDRNHDVVPALFFQANVKADEGETLAYGARTRVSPVAAEAAKELPK